MRLSIIAAVLVVPALAESSARAQVDNYNPRQVIPKPMRAIVNPPVVKASRATIKDNELVIGVAVSGEARAYPINQLTGPRREIINDTLGGTAIAATW